MRVDACRKCGMERKEYDDSARCQTCGRGISQFICVRCQIVSEPQYHIHGKAVEDALKIMI